MSKQEVYKSSTMGPIPLSFTGRHLLQSLREAVQDMIAKSDERVRRGQISSLDWEPVSRARGRIAQYMSQLERKNIPADLPTDAQMAEMLRKQEFEVCRPAPWQPSYRQLQEHVDLLSASLAKELEPKSAFDGCTTFMGVPADRIADVIAAGHLVKKMRAEYFSAKGYSAEKEAEAKRRLMEAMGRLSRAAEKLAE
jgi:hypothetical protein